MTNAFTKKYLTELIDGRIEAIGEAPGINTEDEKLLRQMRVENILFEANQLTAVAQKYTNELHELLNQYEEGDHTTTIIGEIREVSSKLNYLTRYTESKHDSKAVNAVEERIRKERQRGGGFNPQAELSRLQRVKAYLANAPAEEFSLTLMQRLGFIDIIKTAINS